MAHTLVETSTFTANVDVPDDGDDLDAASVEVPLQAITNRTRFMRNQLTGTAPITGDIDIVGNLGITLDLEVGNSISAQNEIYAQSTIWTDADMWAGDDLECVGTLTVGAGATITGSLTATLGVNTGNISASGPITSLDRIDAGAASRRPKRISDGPDATTTVFPANDDIVFAILSATRTWTLSTSGAVQGDECLIHNDTPGGYALNIEAGAEDSTVGPGEVAWYVFHGGIWRLIKKW